jgi:hypothetical protein
VLALKSHSLLGRTITQKSGYEQFKAKFVPTGLEPKEKQKSGKRAKKLKTEEAKLAS